ncbi:MAG: DUF4276 family protein [Alphaproteobacteria bacterium]|nr:DUF4276 family protein [Alphaproteobacteria bacterium]
MTRLVIFIEGGNNDEYRDFRYSFKNLLAKIIPESRQYHLEIKMQLDRGRVVRDFCKEFKASAHLPNYHILMLLDGEEKRAENTTPLTHIKQHNLGWELDTIPEHSVFIMQICIESWFVADSALFTNNCPPENSAKIFELLKTHYPTDQHGKTKITEILNQACNHANMGEYHKIKHALQFIRNLNPEHAKINSPSFSEFYNGMNNIASRS